MRLSTNGSSRAAWLGAPAGRAAEGVTATQALPFAEITTSNIAMVDVLHHVEFPMVFFEEAARVLRPGGRIIMVEPAITFGSSLFYRLLHHEPVIISAGPLFHGHT